MTAPELLPFSRYAPRAAEWAPVTASRAYVREVQDALGIEDAGLAERVADFVLAQSNEFESWLCPEGGDCG